LDVLEIDGASNRGIEDIRSLRANVNVKSMRTRYKVYIIDEVHMLTREAFNALLKTLEEPPPTVKFIFCTTEPNKLPDTILSRCQRFDFGTIDTPSISQRLAQIAAAEGVAVDEAAVELVSRRAAGSMRDSQSLFDQLLAFGGDPITAADVHRLFGTADAELLTQIFDAAIAGDKATGLQLLDSALNQGVQLGEITTQLLEYLRDLMVLATGAEQVGLSAVPESSREKLVEQAGQWGLQTIVMAMEILSQAKGRMQRVTFGRALAELALVRIASLNHVQDVSDLIAQVKSGAIPAPASAPASAPRRLQPPVSAPVTAPESLLGQQAEKKTEPQPVVEPDLAEDSAAPTSAIVEFLPGSEQAVWTEVLSRLTDMTKNNLKMCSKIAISGPNALEICFPHGYYINHEYCRRREPSERLENALREVTGRKISVTMKLLEAPESPTTQQQASSENGGAQNGNASVQRRVDPENDPLVKKALDVFNATVVKVEER